jgi:hypothetical protein
MTLRSLLIPVLLAPAAVGLAGCGITDPYTAQQATTTPHAPTTGPVVTATVTDPSEPPPFKTTATAGSGVTQAPVRAGASSPRQALELYTGLYVNWTAQTIGAHQRQLAGLAGGTARAAALQAAASYGRDNLLEHSHVSNTGVLVSIAAGKGPEHGDWVIVTSERTTGQNDYAGLPATAHVTYAHVTHTPDGWVINRWSPQS